MMQSGLLTICRIAMMSLLLLTGTQSFPDSSTKLENCLWFTEISFNNIRIAWDTSCYNENDESYGIQLISYEYCEATMENSECTGNCTIDIFGMDCYPDPTKACSDATFFITGSTSNLNLTLSTKFAPQITSNDWKLLADINNDTDTLLVSWGPPDIGTSASDVSCATDAIVEATCMSIDNEPLDLEPGDAEGCGNGCGNATLYISKCMQADIDITVTYVLDIPTTTKASITKFYAGGITVTPTEPSTVPGDNSTLPIPVTEGSSGLNGGEIAGIVIAVVIVVAGVVAIVVYIVYKKRP